jgi:hypothetical protein
VAVLCFVIEADQIASKPKPKPAAAEAPVAQEEVAVIAQAPTLWLCACGAESGAKRRCCTCTW